jgi:hypothetical protein
MTIVLPAQCSARAALGENGNIPAYIPAALKSPVVASIAPEIGGSATVPMALIVHKWPDKGEYGGKKGERDH